MDFKLWLENDLLSWFGNSKVVDKFGRPKRVFHGTPRANFKTFKSGMSRFNFHEAGQIGIWFTDDPLVAQTFAHRTEDEYYTKPGEVWPDGEPKQFIRDKHIYGKVHCVYLKLENPKIYAGEDGFESMLDDRDQFVKYISGEKGKGSWRQRYITMNRDEANQEFVNYLKSQGHDGIIIQNTKWDAVKKNNNQYVVFDPHQIRNALE